MNAKLTDTHNSKDKRRPIEERIAALMGRSCYVDLRDGLGGTDPLKLKDEDIAAALGVVAQVKGKVAMMALETHYGSTLMHQHALLRAWEDRERRKGYTREAIVLTRFAGALAIRRLAGIIIGASEYSDLAYLMYSRREALQNRVSDAMSWLEGERDTALRTLRRILKEPEPA